MTKSMGEKLLSTNTQEENDVNTYWAEYLNGSNVQLIVPEHNLQREATWATASCTCDAELTESLRMILQGEEMNLTEMLIASIGLLLSRWSRETDVTLGLGLVSESEMQRFLKDRRVPELIFPIRLEIKEQYDIYSLVRYVGEKIRDAATHCTGSYDVISGAACADSGCFQVRVLL